jgi:hypothetical protein
VNFTAVASDAQVPRTTVYEYFDILRDTLILHEVPAWTRSSARKPLVSPKYYLFDIGIASWLQGWPGRSGFAEIGLDRSGMRPRFSTEDPPKRWRVTRTPRGEGVTAVRSSGRGSHRRSHRRGSDCPGRCATDGFAAAWIAMREEDMRKLSKVALMSTVGALLVAGGDVGAGQFKRINASGLAAGALILTWASPQNQGAAMEMDVYEYLTAAAAYRCRIGYNSTGRQLTLARLGVNGTIQASCTTPVNGVCDLPYVSHAGGLLFQCLVATGNGSPVAAGSLYAFAIQRQPTAAVIDERSVPGPSGLAGTE